MIEGTIIEAAEVPVKVIPGALEPVDDEGLLFEPLPMVLVLP